MRTLIFVYGTLKRGQVSQGLLQGQKFVDTARTSAKYRLYDAGRFPVLVEVQTQGRSVRGEVWHVDDSGLQRLDQWEDVPKLFCRRRIELENMAQPVWAYFFTGDVSGYPECGEEWPP
jgi:gamma-glutamylaminecyclotransferase